MLKGIDRRLSAEILHVLMQMGHGDDLLLCDINHPAVTIAAQTTHGRLIDMGGCDLLQAAEAVLSLMPLDSFVPAPVARMQVVDAPERTLPLFDEFQALCTRMEGRAIALEPLERFAFYSRAKGAFAVIRTSDPGPYGCFILKKGVIDLPR
ncbi:RbsD/FucU family protein [Stagnihabitans tardus]|uniref:Fucose-binding protein n=1 Tax=Stagnihabitans tardus TaxID=2699202 RepID=A0AAE4YFG1_9RHOB|nr:RbsD/FucU domain-containing protein [Stagnihabitans tardus]NBZ88930.1 fucose-binding protein [Stagnihabitans tardus]